MALSEDQRAMLRLLAQREQGYEDIAALMGLSVAQVRAKVKEALEEIESEEAPPVSAPTPPVDPEPTEVAPTPESAPAPSPPAEPTARAKPTSARRRWVEWAGGAAIVILVALFATGAVDIGGGGSDSDTAATTANSPSGDGESSAPADSSQVTKAVLAPVAGGEGAGLALFGRIKKTAILQVEAKGLAPTAKGQSYTVWLYRSPKLVLRVGAVAVGRNGVIAAQFPLPREVLEVVAAGAFDQIDISRTENTAYEAEVARAKKQKRLPAYSGEDVLRGEITGPAIKKPAARG